MDLNKINWAGVVQKYTSPHAIKDFDLFLDALPVRVGYNALIATGLVWALGAAAIWFTSKETEKVSQLHTSLMEVEALRPPVPVLQYVPVSADTLQPLAKKIMETYKGINLSATTAGAVTVSASDTDYFPQFLAAISYLQRGGKNWKVQINSLCVGRDCVSSKLDAKLKVEIVRFGEPETKKETKD